MKQVQETFAIFFFTICFSLAVGIWIGSVSLGFFKPVQTTPKQSAATASEVLPKISDRVRVPILVYHSVRPHIAEESAYQEMYDITPEILQKHLIYLQENGYHAISFNALADYFEKNIPLPEKPVILTFDDGWKNQYEYAFPLLKKFHTTATFFVYTNAMGLRHYFSWDDVDEMHRAGMSIEAHTKTHPYLIKITDPEERKREIAGSKKILEEELGTEITSMAYPFGQYDDASIEEVKSSGFRTARSLRGGVMQSENEQYVLRASLATDNFEAFKKFLEQ